MGTLYKVLQNRVWNNLTMKLIEGGICAVEGVKAWGIKPGKYGLAIIIAKGDASGVFTRNKVIAAPLIITKNQLSKHKKIHAVIANSGNANAFTGSKGFEDAANMVQLLSDKLSIEKDLIAVASTGVIGQRLDIQWIENNIDGVIDNLGCEKECSTNAAKAIMTTDTTPKEIAIELESGIRIGGIAKGSGMIEPNMGTMLGFIYTDAKIDADILDTCLKNAVDLSFNMISVDGDTSTNDMVLLTATSEKNINFDIKEFQKGLEFVLIELAKKIVIDGEGATKLIEVQVINAKSKNDARIAAKAVVRSPLVKTAFSGEDANWGRVVAAIGYSGAEVISENISLSFSFDGKEEFFVEAGEVKELTTTLKNFQKEFVLQKEICIKINLGLGKECATAWGCDLTCDYVKINADYLT